MPNGIAQSTEMFSYSLNEYHTTHCNQYVYLYYGQNIIEYDLLDFELNRGKQPRVGRIRASLRRPHARCTVLWAVAYKPFTCRAQRSWPAHCLIRRRARGRLFNENGQSNTGNER